MVKAKKKPEMGCKCVHLPFSHIDPYIESLHTLKQYGRLGHSTQVGVWKLHEYCIVSDTRSKTVNY